MANFSLDDKDNAGSGDGGDSGIIDAPFLTGNDGSAGSDVDANGDRFDPGIHSGRDKFNADGSYRKKRGRRAGGGNVGNQSGRKTANSSSVNSVESLTRVLAVLHVGIASTTKTPEMVLEEVEAKSLAEATAKVLEEFDIRPDPKIEALVGLMMVAGSIYGPRAYLIAERKKKEREDGKGAN